MQALLDMSNVVDNIELAANIYKQISEQLDPTKPFPQDVEVKMEMNLICDKPRALGVFIPND